MMPKRSVLKGGSAQYYKLTKAHDDGYIDLQVIQFLKVPFLVIGTCDSQCHLSWLGVLPDIVGLTGCKSIQLFYERI